MQIHTLDLMLERGRHGVDLTPSVTLMAFESAFDAATERQRRMSNELVREALELLGATYVVGQLELKCATETKLTVAAFDAFIQRRGYRREHGAVTRDGLDGDEFKNGYAFAMAEVYDLLEGRTTTEVKHEG